MLAGKPAREVLRGLGTGDSPRLRESETNHDLNRLLDKPEIGA